MERCDRCIQPALFMVYFGENLFHRLTFCAHHWRKHGKYFENVHPDAEVVELEVASSKGPVYL